MKLFILRLSKLIRIFRNWKFLIAFINHRVLAASEHFNIINPGLKTIIDIGANRGQFALACIGKVPLVKIHSFEPLQSASDFFEAVFTGEKDVKLYKSAIGEYEKTQLINLSAKDDSSSLLPIGQNQITQFPGTQSIGQIKVNVAPLSKFLNGHDIESTAMLKIDVQGYELQVLKGCEDMLKYFQWVYCECSYMELYLGQALAPEIISWLYKHNFVLVGVYNSHYDKDGVAIQSDLLFELK
jgi:FkbM family methyltransferase